jgi:anti-sigma factor RsiW
MSELRCVSGVELLADYLEGVLDPAVRDDLERHVAGCPRCQAFLAAYRATPEILRHATNDLLPDDLQATLRKALGLT